MHKLQIKQFLNAFDRKDRDFYDNLSPELQKDLRESVFFNLARWISSINESYDWQQYQLIAANKNLNKNFFSFYKHPKLQWLSATTISPNLGTHNYQYISRHKERKANPIASKLEKLFPHYKDDEIQLLAELITKKELTEYLKLHGEE